MPLRAHHAKVEIDVVSAGMEPGKSRLPSSSVRSGIAKTMWSNKRWVTVGRALMQKGIHSKFRCHCGRTGRERFPYAGLGPHAKNHKILGM